MKNEKPTSIWRMVPVTLACAGIVMITVGALKYNHREDTVAAKANSPEAKVTWLTDFPKALAQAKAEHKLVLLSFGGSTWCPACQLLDKRVLTTKAFADFAAANLVLVSVDLPEDADSLSKANDKLVEQFKIDPLPALVFVNADGKELFRMEGYDGSPAKEFVASLEHAISHVKKT